MNLPGWRHFSLLCSVDRASVLDSWLFHTISNRRRGELGHPIAWEEEAQFQYVMDLDYILSRL